MFLKKKLFYKLFPSRSVCKICRIPLLSFFSTNHSSHYHSTIYK